MVEGTIQIPLGRRRIIKRPRLLRLLDDSRASLILLVAPAGYGKTTLARQWLAEASIKHAWYTATPPSGDVSGLALGLARALEPIVPGPTERMRQRLLAVPTSESEPEVLADILANSAAEWPDDAWLVVDDYQHVAASPIADAFFARLAHVSGMRLLLTSRTHPSWASARRAAYSEVVLVEKPDLALTRTESAAVLGVTLNESLEAIVEATEGWPVVTGLAAVAGDSAMLELPSAEALYDYLADEVFNAASPETRMLLCRLAFVSAPTLDLARRLAPSEAVGEQLAEAERLGLLEREQAELRLHPLLRDFFRARFAEYPPAEREATFALLTEHMQATHAWDDLFDLVRRDPSPERLDVLIAVALRELVADGRLGTLEAWCDLAEQQRIETASVQLARAELSWAHGNPNAALPLALGAARALGDTDPLGARAWIVAGRSAHFLDRYDDAVHFYRKADQLAHNEPDSLEALWGHFIAIKGMVGFDADTALETLAPIQSAGIDGVLRYANARVAVAERVGGADAALEETLPLVPFAGQGRNVLIRTGFLNSVARGLLAQARYDEALEVFQEATRPAEELGLRFALPCLSIGRALAELGLRRFGRATAFGRRAEIEARACDDSHNLVECEILRVEMSIALGALDDAVLHRVTWLRQPGSVELGELTACRALAHACAGAFEEAANLLDEARKHIEITPTRVSQASTRLVIALGRSQPLEPHREALVQAVAETGTLNPLVTACRGVPELVPVLCSNPDFAPVLTAALLRSRDFSLLDSAGRDPQTTSIVRKPMLSPREEEVYALLSRGLANKEIGRTLFISDATVKVHLRHIFRKLGVRTRLEALARGATEFGETTR